MKKDAILCDVDGTIALMKGKRGPFEYHKADKDVPNEIVITTVLPLKNVFDCKLIMLSARENVIFKEENNKYSSVFDLTVNWLDNYLGKNWDDLILRPAGDYRKDCYVKYDIYNELIRPHYNIISVFDDRNQVVDMWRNGLGLQCFQVADGNF